MRLIDVEKLVIETQSLEELGQSEMEFYSVEQIADAPTVDTIPREKIDKMIAEIDTRLDGLVWTQKCVNDIKGIIHKYCDKEHTNE